MKHWILLLIPFFSLPSQAAVPPGAWKLASRSCSSDAPYEDPFFARFVTELRWEFQPDGTLLEKLKMFDPEKNFTCLAELRYSVTQLPIENGKLGNFPRLSLQRLSLDSSCLRSTTRPEQFEIGVLLYPDFLETYEEPGAACPGSDLVVTQLRRP